MEGRWRARWLAAAALLCSTFARGTPALQIHEHLTPGELRSVFHVDHHSQIPDYHLVQLTHHVSRRHLDHHHQSNSFGQHSSKIPHEKGLSKTSKEKPPSLLNDEMFVRAKEYIADVDLIGDLNQTVSLNFDVSKSSESDKPKEEGNKDSIEISEASPETSTSKKHTEIDDLRDTEHLAEDQEDDVHKIDLEAFGQKLNLVLKKQNGLFKKDGVKMWNLIRNDTQPHGVDIEETDSGSPEDIGEVFQDEATGAALIIRRDPKKGKLVVEGSIGHDLVIRPLPPTVAPDDDEMFLDPGSMEDMVSIDTGLPLGIKKKTDRRKLKEALSGAQHVIIKRDPAKVHEADDFAFMEPDHLSQRYRRKRSTEEHSVRRKREAPYVIYPEILVIVDYDGYRLHGGDNVQIKRYFVSFWNGVDLRYKLLKGPRVRISIAGIIISRGRDATPYLERNRVGRDAIDSAAALTDMGKYLFRERRLPVYDIAVAITKLDMCRRQYANDACNRGTAGFAYVGGACVVNKRLEKVNSVAIIEDTGGFSGIIVAAHEVGHLLGAVHDGSPPPSYLGGPGADKCRWEDGFIMSDLRHTEKGFRWSPCSVQSFHHFLNGDTATCLYNSPHEDDSLPRVLPGRLLSLDAQCRKDRGTSACFKDERVCAQLFCFDAGSGYCVAYRPAAEGSPCGDGQYCINGRCITEHENIIPDYSQHTASYLRPDGTPFYSNNITSQDIVTQPYPPQTQFYNYEVKRTDFPDYYHYSVTTPSTTVTIADPYKYYFYSQSSTQNPYDYNFQNFAETKSTSNTVLPSSISTQPPFVYNRYSVTSSKNPYDFNAYTTRSVQTTKSTTTYKPFSFNYYSKSTTGKASDAYSDKDVSWTSTTTTRRAPIFSFGKAIDKERENQSDHSKFSHYDKGNIDGYVERSTTKSPFAFSSGSKSKSLYKIGTYYTQQKDNAIRPDASQQVAVDPSGLANGQ